MRVTYFRPILLHFHIPLSCCSRFLPPPLRLPCLLSSPSTTVLCGFLVVFIVFFALKHSSAGSILPVPDRLVPAERRAPPPPPMEHCRHIGRR